MGTPERKGMPIEIPLVTFFAEYLNISFMVLNCNIQDNRIAMYTSSKNLCQE